jgi:hypothetical protein
MESIVGIFSSLTDARRGVSLVQSLGIPNKRISVLAPGVSEPELKAFVATSETEQPGMGSAVGGTVGGALGVAGGMSAGAAASLLVPGIGPVLALGMIGAVLLGAGGAVAGAAAGEAMEDAIAQGLPRDELFVYEDALRKGRSIVIALADDETLAKGARAELVHAGAESVDEARHEWWIGLRDAEQEHYEKQGGDFSVDEAIYRLGFEAALHPDRRGKSYHEVAAKLHETYDDQCMLSPFRKGYERGQQYHLYIIETHKA